MTFTRLSYYNNQVSSRENKNNTAQAVVVIVHHEFEYGILAQLGEHLPYKQRVIGSSPIGPIYKIFRYADVAQLAEQLICNQQVIGSSPIIGFYCKTVNNVRDYIVRTFSSVG